MTTDNPSEFSGLTSLPGVQVISDSSVRSVVCPFCASANVARLAGKITFAAKIGNVDLFDGEAQPLIAIICSKSHVFFLREMDSIHNRSGNGA